MLNGAGSFPPRYIPHVVHTLLHQSCLSGDNAPRENPGEIPQIFFIKAQGPLVVHNNNYAHGASASDIIFFSLNASGSRLF
jgi:hypothetical protein